MLQGSQGSRIRANERLIDEMNATTPPYGTLAIWLLGQESIVVKGDGILLYFDPFVSDDVRSKLGLQRLYEPPLVPADITNAAVSLITHDHEDHLDAGTMKVICHSSPDSLVIAPKYCASTIRGLALRLIVSSMPIQRSPCRCLAIGFKYGQYRPCMSSLRLTLTGSIGMSDTSSD
ncbi:hypothetical protein [Paenibacillus sp. BR1-192]|uniref:MBL fold metallo-hydrolase n=1 Tax=Paenibacillus sp. BR1-192 TaxID=3032287 RepID=UPI00240DF0D2|nr:hypothetical protein [Paenibacillus sp. BR1-192]WFB59653.1 hypothetical protein P0X86_05265 [Paenibacillus sp. BR1-192]